MLLNISSAVAAVIACISADDVGIPVSVTTGAGPSGGCGQRCIPVGLVACKHLVLVSCQPDLSLLTRQETYHRKDCKRYLDRWTCSHQEI